MDSTISTALAASQARVAIAHLTIEDARKAKAAIEAELATWEAGHPYANCQIYNLAAIVGAPGVMTWQAHFHESHLPDVVFEVDGERVFIATRVSFWHYQFQQDPSATSAVAQEGGVA